MKLLLTSAGLTNPTIVESLEQLLGQPLSQSRAVYIPTALHATPEGVDYAWQMLQSVRPAEWANIGMLELTALESVTRDHWVPSLEAADAVLVGGGNTPYLSHWYARSGFAHELRRMLPSTVYVGVSAGSLLAGSGFYVSPQRLTQDGVYDDDLYGDEAPKDFGSDETLRLVDFAIMPHLDSAYFDGLTLERIAPHADGPTYVIDDESAVVVDGDSVRVVSEGRWQYLPG